MEKLIAGIVKFQRETFNQDKELFQLLAKQQSPEVLFITCSDSRIDPNLITQTKPGELFIARNAGNFVPPYYAQATNDMDATLEYALAILGVKHIVICGHTDCGAIKGSIDPDSVKHLHHVSNWLSNGAAAAAKVRARNGNTLCSEQMKELIEENVIQQLRHLETHPSVTAKLGTGTLTLHGWVYDIGRGQVYCYEAQRGCFIGVEEYYAHIIRTLQDSMPDMPIAS
ncbi:MAG TPA: carbonic anhydrase [Hyphomicrobiales bacterium]|nr:carbonic anhydrase [Hyphomicrobiales bacterium]